MEQVKVGDAQPELAAANWAAYVRARDAGHLDYQKIAKRCEDFYLGKQWDPATLSELEQAGRPALTINMVLRTVNAILGEYSGTRELVRFKPLSKVTQAVADALNKLYLQVTHLNNYRMIEKEVFADGIIQDRGYFDVRMDFSKNIAGDVSIRALDNLDVLPDPAAKSYDPRKWNEVFYTRWLSVDDIAAEYGEDKAKKVIAQVNYADTFGPDSVERRGNTFGDTENGFDVDIINSEDDRHVKRIRVIERQYRVFSSQYEFIDPKTGDKAPAPGNWDNAQIQEHALKFGLQVNRSKRKRVRWTVSADTCTLHDSWSPYNHFTIVPFFPYFRRGNPMGVVRNLISPQEQLNKVESQQLHIVNTTANSGWIVEENSLLNMEPEEVEQRGAKTGLVMVKRRGAEEPKKITPNQVPSGLDNIGQKAFANIQQISGVNDGMLGMTGAEVSGIAIEHKKHQGQTMLHPVFDNLQRTRQIMTELLLDLFQTYYTNERQIRLTHAQNDGAAQGDVDPEATMPINQVQMDGSILNDLSQGRYDVVVSSQPSRDAFDETEFAEAMAMRQAGVMIPDDKVVEYSNLANKEDVARRIRIQTGVEPPTPEEAQKLAQQEQLQQQAQQLELAKLEAEVQELLSRAEKNNAQADDIELGQDMRHQQALEQKTAMSMSNDNLRERLARLNADTQLLKQQMQSQQKEKQPARPAA